MSFTTPPGIDIVRLLEFAADRFGDKTALIDNQGELSFAEIETQANRLARALAHAGAAPGDRVALILPNCNPFIVIEAAILKAGMVKVPLNIRFHANEVLYALNDCAPSVLFCDEAYADALAERRGEIPSLKSIFSVGCSREGFKSYDDAVTAGDDSRVHAGFAPDDPVLIRYTGGTTGRPKGIVHTEQSFTATNLDVIREYRLVPEDIHLHLGHLSHGRNFIWAACCAAGNTQILRERFDANAVLDDIARYKVTHTYMVPTMIQRTLREERGDADVSSLKMFMYASAPMPVPLLRQAIQRFGPIFTQVYTLSESPVVTTIFRPEEHTETETSAGPRLASCGREVVTMEIKLLDDDGNEVADGEVGEISVRSLNNMSAYWNLPEETARTLVDGWVRTGDMARRDEEGFLYIVDRKKDVIITGAFNVYPKEVEAVLQTHPGVAMVAVIGVPDEEWGEAIKAFVVPEPGAAPSAEELIELCRNNLADYKKPRQIELVDELPLSPVGKISRKDLRDRAGPAQ